MKAGCRPAWALWLRSSQVLAGLLRLPLGCLLGPLDVRTPFDYA